MKNNVLFRTYRKLFPGKGIAQPPQEEPNPFGCHQIKPLNEEQVKAGYAIIAMEVERQRRLRCGHSGITVAVRQSSAHGQAGNTYLASLDEQITLAIHAGVKSRDISFVLALRERASRLAGNDSISLADIEELTSKMTVKEGWRVGALDRYVMNFASTVCEGEETKLAKPYLTSSRYDNDVGVMPLAPAEGYQYDAPAPASDRKSATSVVVPSDRYAASYDSPPSRESTSMSSDSSPSM